MQVTDAISNYAEEPITKQLMLDLLREYNRPYDKINELVKKEQLLLVKRGVYVPGAKLDVTGPTPFLLANHLWGPSYISLETALSYWGLIPEKVYETSSVTTSYTKYYKTPIGKFSYIHMPLPYYSFGIHRVELTKKQAILIASPEKALCDKIITTSGILLRSAKQVLELLIDDLRIEREDLMNLNIGEISKWIVDAPKKASINMLVKTLKNYDKRMA